MSAISQYATHAFREIVRTRRSRTSFFSYGRTMWLTIALLVVVTAVAILSLINVLKNAPTPDQYAAWSGCGMLVCLAIAVLLLGRYMTQRSLQQVERQLRQLIQNDDKLDTFQTPAADDLRPVMTALSDYVDHVRSRVDRLHLQKKELDIQMRFADAERRNTEAIIHSISDAVLVIDPFGELVLANSAAERLFDFDLSKHQHQPMSRVLQDASLVTLLKEARSTDKRWSRREIEYSALRNGRTQTFKITLSAVVDKTGQSNGLVAVFHDITREREIAQIKTDFVSAVSHELRTPLSSIKAYTEMLMDDEAADEETRRDFYRIIESETDRLQRLVSNILNISRIESGVVDVHRQSIRANDVVKEVIETMAPQSGEKGITFDSQLGSNLPTVWADRDLVHRAIMNLVSNAIKYTNRGGRICITTDMDEDASKLAITVMDNGMGIRAEDLPRIFDKFYRTRECAAVAKGTGLGLNLVKQIVETVHQGEISVTSEYGAGTTFVLRLPLMGNGYGGT